MISLWFWLVWATLSMYVVLDGFDLGVGILHLGIARDGSQRHTLIRSVASVWDGNEVWLIAGGATLFAAFPALFAAGFSGFYLPLNILLWLLALRALGIELQHQLADPMWLRFWDHVFCASSWLIAMVLGAGLGGVVRGVPWTDGGTFFLPLWTDLRPSGEVGVLDVYTVLCALTSAAVLALHGAAWLNMRLTSGELETRVRRIVGPLHWLVTTLVLVLALASFSLQPRALDNLREHLWLVLFPGLSATGLVLLRFGFRHRPRLAFGGSCLLLVGLLGSAAGCIWPHGLPSSNATAGPGLSESAAELRSLQVMLRWWIPGILAALAYHAYVYSRLPALELEEEG